MWGMPVMAELWRFRLNYVCVVLAVAVQTLVWGNATAQQSQTCSSNLWALSDSTGAPGVRAILKDIPLITKWADLPSNTQAQLQRLSSGRLAAFSARWSSNALSTKQQILLSCPTAQMTAAVDDYYRKSFDTVVAPTFSLADVKSTALAHGLARNYLAAMAAFRASLTYPGQKLPNRDWDGKSLFDSVRLPDAQTNRDIGDYAATIVVELKAIDDGTLDDSERALKGRALYDARALAMGAFSGDSFGGSDMEMACEIVGLANDVVMGFKADHGRPKIFATDDDVLREVNAI